jgi:hypothetical protein
MPIPNLRLGTLKDVPVILRMMQEFYSKSGMPYKWDEDKVIDLIMKMINDKENALVLLHTNSDNVADGVICGVVTSIPFSSERVATELVYWVEEGSRSIRVALDLMNGYEYWAKHVQYCDYVIVALLSELEREKVDKLYTRLGYTKKEEAYTKEL